MIKVEIVSGAKVRSFIRQNYTNAYGENMIEAGADDILEFFSGEDKSEWFMIEYRGGIGKIAEYLSLLAYKVFIKCFVDISVSESGSMLDVSDIVNTITDANAYKDGATEIRVSFDDTLSDKEVSFKLISPRYSYKDMWSER